MLSPSWCTAVLGTTLVAWWAPSWGLGYHTDLYTCFTTFIWCTMCLEVSLNWAPSLHAPYRLSWAWPRSIIVIWWAISLGISSGVSAPISKFSCNNCCVQLPWTLLFVATDVTIKQGGALMWPKYWPCAFSWCLVAPNCTKVKFDFGYQCRYPCYRNYH